MCVAVITLPGVMFSRGNGFPGSFAINCIHRDKSVAGLASSMFH